MGRKAFLVAMLCAGLMFCAERDNSFFEHHFYSQSPEQHIMKCNVFNDETFRGELRALFSASGKHDNSCVELHLLKSPGNLFKTEELFVQAYPFNFQDEETVYGPALDIQVYDRRRKVEDEFLLSTHLLDAYLVKKMKSSPDRFLKDYYFKFCSEDLENWSAMQLVVYFEHEDYEEKKHTPIRVTRFLIPPFLSHPDYFQDEQGNALAALHPFLFSKDKGNVKSEHFVKETKALCE